jgi:hypothetical protein
MGPTKHTPPAKPVWAYAYQILPPQAEDRLHMIKTLLDQENADAQRAARTWAGRVVVEQQVTHILVVSDSPEQNHDVNRRLEAQLKDLNAGFSLTVPIAVANERAVVADTPAPGGSITNE